MRPTSPKLPPTPQAKLYTNSLCSSCCSLTVDGPLDSGASLCTCVSWAVLSSAVSSCSVACTAATREKPLHKHACVSTDVIVRSHVKNMRITV
eukprot:1012-Heterococcus_DN1.PRE.1